MLKTPHRCSMDRIQEMRYLSASTSESRNEKKTTKHRHSSVQKHGLTQIVKEKCTIDPLAAHAKMEQMNSSVFLVDQARVDRTILRRACKNLASTEVSKSRKCEEKTIKPTWPCEGPNQETTQELNP